MILALKEVYLMILPFLRHEIYIFNMQIINKILSKSKIPAIRISGMIN